VDIKTPIVSVGEGLDYIWDLRVMGVLTPCGSLGVLWFNRQKNSDEKSSGERGLPGSAPKHSFWGETERGGPEYNLFLPHGGRELKAGRSVGKWQSELPGLNAGPGFPFGKSTGKTGKKRREQ